MDNKDFNIKAGERLKELRLLHGMTQTEVSELLGVTHPTIVRYEKGEVGAMKASVIAKLAEIFHVSPVYILGMDLKNVDIEPISKVKKIPILGSVCAGDGIWCEENFDGFFFADESLAKADFSLIVEGDSMNGDGIYNRDKAFIKKTNVVDNGKIAVVLLTETNEVTLKRIYVENGNAILQPSNPKYKPITTSNFIILGELVGIYHKYN
jgi:repressor LexA